MLYKRYSNTENRARIIEKIRTETGIDEAMIETSVRRKAGVS